MTDDRNVPAPRGIDDQQLVVVESASLVGHLKGGAQALYGRARVQIREVAEDAPYVARQTSERLRVAARRSARAADDGVRDHPFLIAALAGISAYVLAWLIHGRRDTPPARSVAPPVLG